MLKKIFGKNLKRIRKEKKITQEQLSEMVGMNPRQISKIETGEHFPECKNIENICDALNINAYELFKGTQENILDKTESTNSIDSDIFENIIKKIKNLPNDKILENFLEVAIGALYNDDDLNKLAIMVYGMQLSRR